MVVLLAQEDNLLIYYHYINKVSIDGMIVESKLWLDADVDK